MLTLKLIAVFYVWTIAFSGVVLGQQPLASGTINSPFNAFPSNNASASYNGYNYGNNNNNNRNTGNVNNGYNSNYNNNPNDVSQQQRQNPQYGNGNYQNGGNANVLGQQQGFMNQQHALQPLITQQNLTNNRTWSMAMNNGGVNIQLRLNSYTNQQFALPNGQRCVCPDQWRDSCLNDVINIICRFSFTIILSAPDQSVKYIATDFINLPSSGVLNGQSQSSNSSFLQLYSIDMDTKPSAIDIFVHNFGKTINVFNGSKSEQMTVTHADTFILPLKDVLPSPMGSIQQLQSTMLTGKLIATSLSLDYAISCRGSMVGENCDLNCTQSSRNTAKAVCISNTTGYFSICDYTANRQVNNCQRCPWGVGEEAYCRDSQGGALNPNSAGLVSTSYKTWTVILAILSAILFILLVIVLVYSCVLASRTRESTAPGHNYRSSQRHYEGSAQQSLLQTGFNNNGSVRPTAPPRTSRPPPSLDARPGKSSIRRGPLVPPAHLGGAASLNDTLNSSFSTVPMPPSRSADV